jgi:ParB family transcriptional regulator, chromosome partitioning protein
LAKGKQKKSGLGKNQLDWIQDTTTQARQSKRLIELPLDQIVESERLKLRQDLPDIEVLAADIAARGQTTPAFVRPLGDGKYELISGYRRFNALEHLGHDTILARVYEDLSEEDAEQLAISENLQRQDLSELENARICLRLQEREVIVAEIARLMGKKDRTIRLYLAVAKAPETIKTALHEGRISLYIAYELAQLCKRKKSAYLCRPPERLAALIDAIIEQELSVRQVRDHLERLLEQGPPTGDAEPPAAKTKTRREFQPVAETPKKNGFDLTIKYRRREDIDLIIEKLEATIDILRSAKRNPGVEGDE